VQIERGKTLYGIHCAICHGSDLRGGDMGGPNLLRSQVALSDLKGELILPIIHGSRQAGGMPAIAIIDDDGLAVAAYIRSVLETIGVQGKPPSVGREAPSILVGSAREGQAYFAAKCASCHSATGDLQGVAAKFPDPKDLQTWWVRGGERRRYRPDDNPAAPDPRAVTASIWAAGGARVDGRLLHVDDFLITIRLPDGAVRSFSRSGSEPKVEIHDPMKRHRDLLAELTDSDVHDVTAYLATLK